MTACQAWWTRVQGLQIVVNKTDLVATLVSVTEIFRKFDELICSEGEVFYVNQLHISACCKFTLPYLDDNLFILY